MSRIGVAQGGKRGEAWHDDRMSRHGAVDCNDRRSWSDRTDRANRHGAVRSRRRGLAGARTDRRLGRGRRRTAPQRAPGVFVTNNSAATSARTRSGAWPTSASQPHGDVVSSAMAVTSLSNPVSACSCAAGPGVVEALELAGADVVINSGTPLAEARRCRRGRDASRLRLRPAGRRRRRRCASVRTPDRNEHRQHLSDARMVCCPGGGSILAAVAVASGVDPVIAGKPHQPMATLVESMLAERHDAVDPAPGADGRRSAGDRRSIRGVARLSIRARSVGGEQRAVRIDEATTVDLDVADLAEVARRLVR